MLAPENASPPKAVSGHFDVLIIGAGLSGVGAACHLKKNCPSKSFALLESRGKMGGTWDLFRYPGIRSDSDMFTLGYVFRPWTEAKAIADGPSILRYVQDTARENGIDRAIVYHQRVVRAKWSSRDALWTVETQSEGRSAYYTCQFLLMCSGYYRYEAGYTPDFQGVETFRGRVVHPQAWPEDLDYKGKRVLVIGSGATAMTLVPSMAAAAAHVTMLQRSPTYVVSRPATDAIADVLRARLPSKMAYWLTRWKNVLLGMYFFRLSRKKPEQVKKLLLRGVRKGLGPDYDINTHFTPRYNPWDQRLCLIPDGDLFDAIKEGRASVVTDAIDRFAEKGVRLAGGGEIEADIIVTATGLDLQALGGAEFFVDGKPVVLSETLNYKGMMFSDMPNLASVFGYTNASWTLKADLTSQYVCRLINYMDEAGVKICTPHNDDPDVKAEPWVDFSSGYLQRAVGRFPSQGSKAPWRLHQNYASDVLALKYGSLTDKALRFSNPPDKFQTGGPQVRNEETAAVRLPA